MPYERSGGKQCVVIDCRNSQKKLHDWNISVCDEHKIKHKDCECLPPYKLHCIPANEEKRRMWIKSINRKDFNPASKSMVSKCSSINPFFLLCNNLYLICMKTSVNVFILKIMLAEYSKVSTIHHLTAELCLHNYSMQSIIICFNFIISGMLNSLC